MKVTAYCLGLLSCSSLLSLAATSHTPAIAQCVMADVSVQAAIHGSDKPARQRNDVDMQSDGPCVGNTSVSTNRQIHVGGTEQVVQERRSRHRMTGGSNAYGIGGDPVKVPVNVQVDVYNPAERLRNSR